MIEIDDDFQLTFSHVPVQKRMMCYFTLDCFKPQGFNPQGKSWKVLLLLTAFFFSSAALASETLTVAVASSLYPSLQKEVAAFEQHYDVKVRLVSGSTGRLYNQMMQGAPFDVFIAADQEHPALLIKHGKAETSRFVAEAYLGLNVEQHYITDPELLLNPDVRHIAIANPKVAPLGKTSQELLQKLRLWQPLKTKFVYAQNAMQVSMMVHNGLVDAGFVPVDSADLALALIPYHGVILNPKSSADLWLEYIIHALNKGQKIIHQATLEPHG